MARKVGVGGGGVVSMELCIPETDSDSSENEIICSSQMTQSDEERRQFIVDREDRKRRSRAEERRRARLPDEDSGSSEEDTRPPTNTRRPVRYGDGGGTSQDSFWVRWARAKAATEYPRPEMRLDVLMGVESEEQAEAEAEATSSDPDVLPDAEPVSQRPCFDLEVSSTTSDSDMSGIDEKTRMSMGLPGHPELRRGPAYIGPRALTPSPPRLLEDR